MREGMMRRFVWVLLIVVALGLSACGGEPSPVPTAEPFESLVPTADTFESPVDLPNPASKYCVDQGGRLEIRDEAAGQAGYCIFEDGSECEEWAFYRGECAPGTPAP
jgi:putative hemolysin